MLNWKNNHNLKVSIFVVMSLLLSGCNSANAEFHTKPINIANTQVEIPLTWVKLGSHWLSEGSIAGWGDINGVRNTQSIIVHKFTNLPIRPELSESFCQRYILLANSNDGINLKSEVNNQTAKLVNDEQDKVGNYCEINYQYKSTEVVTAITELVFVKDGSVWSIELSAREGVANNEGVATAFNFLEKLHEDSVDE